MLIARCEYARYKQPLSFRCRRVMFVRHRSETIGNVKQRRDVFPSFFTQGVRWWALSRLINRLCVRRDCQASLRCQCATRCSWGDRQLGSRLVWPSWQILRSRLDSQRHKMGSWYLYSQKHQWWWDYKKWKQHTSSMHIGFHQDVHSTHSVKLNFFVFVVSPVT